MLELLEEQTSSLNNDEKRVEANLDFFETALHQVLMSRKDTFKEQVVVAYQQKEDEVGELEEQLEK